MNDNYAPGICVQCGKESPDVDASGQCANCFDIECEERERYDD